jgi:hypothetical protein
VKRKENQLESIFNGRVRNGPAFLFKMKLHDDRALFPLKLDDFVKSRKTPFFVIPAKAGIQSIQGLTKALDSGFHRSDDFLRDHQT